MAWYRRSKLGFDITYRSKITTHKPPIRNPFQIINYKKQSSKLTSYLVSSCVTEVSSLNAHRSSQFRSLGSGYKYYHVMRRFRRSKRPISKSLIVLLGLGVVVTIWSGNVWTVRYKILKHLLIMSTYVERVIGESQLQMMKAEFEWKVLPQMHPDSVRVRKIFKHVIHEMLTELNDALKKREYKRTKLAALYVERLKWEILVVEDDAVYACCLPGGKFVVFTGLLKQFTNDDEIASVVCHEVAHVAIKHVRERLAKNFWRAFGRQIYYMVVKPNLDPRVVFFMLDLPFSPRMEIEADLVGLMLMRSAGYNRRVLPKVYEKMGQVSAFHDYLTIHPMEKLRSKWLSEVGKTVSKQEEAIARQEVDT